MKFLKKPNFIEKVIVLTAFSFCALVLIFSGLYLYIAPQLPDVETLKSVKFETPLQILSQEGKLIAEYGEKHTTPLRYDQIPPLFVKAILAAEDDKFFEHEGINSKGLLRAFADILRTGSIQSGGSTITMQVAKNYFLSQERTFSRKFTEILLAKRIEDSLNKQEILTLYINKIFLGHRAYGIGAAAQVYYGKKINELNLAEIAMIAGLPKAPSIFNPVNNPTRALIRRDWILGRMLQLGYIDQNAYNAAVKAPVGLNFKATYADVNAPWVAEMIRTDLVNKYGEDIYLSGYKVYTTINANRQNAASAAVINGLIAYDKRHGWRGSEKATHLANLYPVGGLEPAQVTEVKDKEILATLRNGTVISIPWEGISWARKYINVNSIGPAPKSAHEVVKKQDFIRVRLNTKNTWDLLQIPETQGLLVSVDHSNGAINALVGGFDYTNSKFNRVTQGWRQAGSTMKPFIYSAALEKGYTAASIVNDSPLSLGDGPNAWKPSNSDGEYLGPITLRRALYMSRNMVSIRLLQAVGIEDAQRYLQQFGFNQSKLPDNLTIALGSAEVLPIQMVTGYAAIANGGFFVSPWYVDHITDKNGKVLFKAHPIAVCASCETAAPSVTEINGVGSDISVTQKPSAIGAPRVMSATASFLMQSILRDVVVHGTGRAALSINRSDVAGKTGTTNDAKDAWFAGFGGKLATVTWIGFDRPETLGRIEYGGYAALPIWTAYMAPALQGMPENHMPTPAGLVSARLNRDTGLATDESDPRAYMDWIPGTAAATESTPDSQNSKKTAEEVF